MSKKKGPVGIARRRKLVQRLWSAAEVQVADIEQRLGALSGDSAALERDARTLGLLAKFLKELVGIECLLKDANAPPSKTKGAIDDDDAPPRDLDAFREELARRLDRMRQTREPAIDPDGPRS